MEKMAKNGSYSCSIEILNFFPRLFWEIQKWTKKMSKNEKGKYFTPKILILLHNEKLASQC